MLYVVVRFFAPILLAGLAMWGCSPQAQGSVESAPRAVEEQSDTRTRAEARPSGSASFDLIAPSEIVAEGQRPVVMMFFATWCELCSYKLETVRRATSEIGGADLVLVAVDDANTKHHIPGFLREHRMPDAPVVDGLSHPAFVEKYNPAAALPFVLVMNGAGEPVDAQIGLRSGDGRRLEKSLRLALLD